MQRIAIQRGETLEDTGGFADSMLNQTARYVTIEDIEVVLTKAGESICETSVDKLKSILHGIFEYGYRRRYCDRNPVVGARIPANCVPSSRARKNGGRRDRP